MAADQWDMAYIGRMKVPSHVTFEKGEQQALPFLTAGGPRRFFTRHAMLDGYFYTMTYADGSNFSYGWAASVSLGSQFLQAQGDNDYRGKTPTQQMDSIASQVNDNIARMGASYTGETALQRIDDDKHPRWEGTFTIVTKERDITYRQTYHTVLQISGFRVVMGIISLDADQTALSESLGRMLAKRRFYQDKDLIAKFLEKGSEKIIPFAEIDNSKGV